MHDPIHVLCLRFAFEPNVDAIMWNELPAAWATVNIVLFLHVYRRMHALFIMLPSYISVFKDQLTNVHAQLQAAQTMLLLLL